jgi:hypothetical protein
MQDGSVARRIIYVVIRPDFNVHTDKHLSIVLEGLSTQDVEVVHDLLS